VSGAPRREGTARGALHELTPELRALGDAVLAAALERLAADPPELGSTLPPAEVARSALVTRLPSTCRSRSESAYTWAGPGVATTSCTPADSATAWCAARVVSSTSAMSMTVRWYASVPASASARSCRSLTMRCWSTASSCSDAKSSGSGSITPSLSASR
jgi:hypothetical protein